MDTPLQALASVYGLAATPDTPLDTLQQTRTDLLQVIQLHTAVKQHVLPARSIQVEMQVAAILGWMEHDGMGEPTSTSCKLHRIVSCTAVWRAKSGSVCFPETLCALHRLTGHAAADFCNTCTA